MKKVILIIAVLLIAACLHEPEHKRRVLDEEVVADNMQAYLKDKYGILYDINGVRMLDDPIDGLLWFKGTASSGEESFFVLADEYSETFRDARYLSSFHNKIEAISDSASEGLWEDAEVLSSIKLPELAFKNGNWSPDSSLSDFFATEYVIAGCTVIIPEASKKEEDLAKFHQYISSCIENGLTTASFALDYRNSDGHRKTRYFIDVREEDEIPGIEDIEIWEYN